MGALSNLDGQNVLVHHSEAGCNSIPVEVIESRTPMLVEKFEIRADSGGPGKYRGGLGATKIYRTLQDCIAIAVLERVKGTAPRGLAGGGSGRRGLMTFFMGTDREIRLGRTKQTMAPGDLVKQDTHGGGGYGNPLQRNADAVRADVRNGYVTAPKARTDYGVVVDKDGLHIDVARTKKLRAELGGNRPTAVRARA
jgi:N-methylhydantoinase B